MAYPLVGRCSNPDLKGKSQFGQQTSALITPVGTSVGKKCSFFKLLPRIVMGGSCVSQTIFEFKLLHSLSFSLLWGRGPLSTQHGLMYAWNCQWGWNSCWFDFLHPDCYPTRKTCRGKHANVQGCMIAVVLLSGMKESLFLFLFSLILISWTCWIWLLGFVSEVPQGGTILVQEKLLIYLNSNPKEGWLSY